MKVLLFENEFVYLDTAFKYVNKLYFDDKLEFSVYANSQDFGDLRKSFEFHIIFVDISLAKKSDLDGFGILKKLQELGYDQNKVIILTGNHQIKESLKDKGLSYPYRILTKPVDLKDLIYLFNEISR